MATNSIAIQEIAKNPHQQSSEQPTECNHIIGDAFIKQDRKKAQNDQWDRIVDQMFPTRMKQWAEKNASQSNHISRHNPITIEFP